MTAPPRIGVLALQGDVREHESALSAVGAEAVRVRSLLELASVEALVIPGGESTTMSKLALSNGLMEPLRDITVRRNAFGRQVDSFETEIGIVGVGHDPVHAVFIRAPWVESAGAEVEVLGTIETGDDAGTIVAVRQGPLLATSFHPELTGDHRIHRMFLEIVRRSR